MIRLAAKGNGFVWYNASGLFHFACFCWQAAPVLPSSRHIGSPLEAIARDAAVTVSIALQFGAPLATIRAALTKDHDGSPATLLGKALDEVSER
jgi:hypothetical protein